VKRGRKIKHLIDDGELLPSATGDAEMHGPDVGTLYDCGDGTQVRVIGRAWALFDHDDAIQVEVARTDATITEELSGDEFAALIANARVVL
jgi:hypothetical protein